MRDSAMTKATQSARIAPAMPARIGRPLGNVEDERTGTGTARVVASTGPERSTAGLGILTPPPPLSMPGCGLERCDEVGTYTAQVQGTCQSLAQVPRSGPMSQQHGPSLPAGAAATLGAMDARPLRQPQATRLLSGSTVHLRGLPPSPSGCGLRRQLR